MITNVLLPFSSMATTSAHGADSGRGVWSKAGRGQSFRDVLDTASTEHGQAWVSLGRMAQIEELGIVTPKCPLKALPALNPLPACGRWEPGFPLQHLLVFSSFLAISSPVPPSLLQTWASFSERTRGLFGGGVSLTLSSGIALALMGRLGTNKCPAPASGKGKIPGCKVRRENYLGLNSWVLCVAIYGCTFCSKPDARHCKRERKQTGESQPEREKPGGRNL